MRHGIRHSLMPRVALVALLVVVSGLTIAPSAGATTPDLSIDVTSGNVVYRAADIDTAGFKGTFSFDGEAASCGADVYFSMGEGNWKAEGDDFHADKGRCIFRRGNGRIRSVFLNFGNGTWALSLKVELSEDLSPFEAHLRIGQSKGSQMITMRPTRNGWAYP